MLKERGKKMKLWYSSPARQWCEALPVGNGRLGGMVYGGCAHELIKLNEDSIWSGKALDRINPDALENLQKIREMLHDGQIEEAERLAARMIRSGTTLTVKRVLEASHGFVVRRAEGYQEAEQLIFPFLSKIFQNRL